MLASIGGINSDGFPLNVWPLKLTKLLCNVDQAPLSFVVSQETECDDGDDKDIHETAPSDALCKRQFIVNIHMSAREGDDRDGCKVLALIEKI